MFTGRNVSDNLEMYKIYNKNHKFSIIIIKKNE